LVVKALRLKRGASDMVSVTRVVLDVLKPHQPNALEFTRAIAERGAGYRVHVTVLEVDEHTETLKLVVEADAIDFGAVESTIEALGGSVHSIDEVEVRGAGAAPGRA
jgi:hypothetical protein